MRSALLALAVMIAGPPDYSGVTIAKPADQALTSIRKEGHLALLMDNRFHGEWRLFDLQKQPIGKVRALDSGDTQVLEDVNGRELERQPMTGVPDRCAAELAARHSRTLVASAAAQRAAAKPDAPVAQGWRVVLDGARFKVLDGTQVVVAGTKLHAGAFSLADGAAPLGDLRLVDEAWHVYDVAGYELGQVEGSDEAAMLRALRLHLPALKAQRKP